MATPKEDVPQVDETQAAPAEATPEFKSSAYGKALTALKAKHKAEFDSILAGIYTESGFKYQPRLTPDERKRAELVRLAAELGVTISEG